MSIKIIFENEELMVINKPAFLRVHADGKSDAPTVVDWIIEQYPQIKGVGESMLINGKTLDRPGIVHRLDEQTSGALIIAKTQELFLSLKDQFKNRDIKKEYHAFVWGHFKEKSGSIDQPIGRSQNDFRRWQSGRGIRGETREAETLWSVERMFQDKTGERFSLVYLYPKTGRTHQLRVHMKYLQRPIVSDSLYAPTKPQALGFERLALHARKIEFIGLKGEKIEVTAPYPKDFEIALSSLAEKALL